MRTLLTYLFGMFVAVSVYAQNSLEPLPRLPWSLIECDEDTCVSNSIVENRRIVGHSIKPPVGDPEDDTRYGYADARGVLIVPMKFKTVNDFTNGLALVQDPDDPTCKKDCCPERWYHIKIDGTPLYPERYCSASKFVNGYARVEATGVYDMFHIDTKGRRLYPQKYTWLFDFTKGGLSLVQKVRKGTKELSFNWFVINTKGDELKTLAYHGGDPGEAKSEFLRLQQNGELSDSKLYSGK